MIKKLFGDRLFYKRLMQLALPIMIQNGITNFVGMLDNIMVGRIGTYEMTGVAVSNQLIFVYNLCIIGAVSGAGIFSAQFFGKGDHSGVRDTFRFKVIFGILLSIIGIAVLILFGGPLINLYLKGDGGAENAIASFGFARKYILIMLIGFFPYTIVQCYASTLRETGQSLLPMYAGIAAVFINLGLNYVLIFGNFGAPKLGVEGAAIATVISRFAELVIVMGWTHKHSRENKFIIGAYRSLRIPKALIKSIMLKGMPLMINETLWAGGVAALNQCYSIRGLNVVAANNISQTFFNVFSVAFVAIGAAIGIILGQMLGAGETAQVKSTAAKLITFSVVISIVISAIYILIAEFIPEAYNTNAEVKYTAARLMQITAVFMPLDAMANACYFTLRSGGKMFITILFDSCFMWVLTIPVAFVISRYTDIPILYMYTLCQSLNAIKCVLGFIFVKKGIWIRNLVADQK